MWVLAYSNAFNVLWPIFGTANQLLAALTLFAVSAWLLLRRRPNWFTLIPGVFMLLTTLASLFILMRSYWLKQNYVLLAADLLLLGLAVGVIFLFVRTFSRGRKERSESKPDQS